MNMNIRAHLAAASRASSIVFPVSTCVEVGAESVDSGTIISLSKDILLCMLYQNTLVFQSFSKDLKNLLQILACNYDS